VKVSGAVSEDSWWHPPAGAPGWAYTRRHARQPARPPRKGEAGIDLRSHCCLKVAILTFKAITRRETE
jgi:hypothetical protein